jgi:SAM-dependent methyltransferase
MIEWARADHSGIRFEEGGAEALPFAEGSFDAVVANFGIRHVPNPVRALSEARRVLRTGGRTAFTTWAASAENIAWQLLFDAISAHGSLEAANSPPRAVIFACPRICCLLNEARFTETEAHRVQREWRISAARDLLEGFRCGTVRTAALIGAQSTFALPAIEAAIARAGATYRTADGLAIPIVAILASGVRG